MKYNDKELWDFPESVLNQHKTRMTMDDFCQWSSKRLAVLIAESVNSPDWMHPDNVGLRTYRVKAMKFYEDKMVKV